MSSGAGSKVHRLDSPRAWLTVVAAFFASGVTLGTAYSFGAFFESMSEEFESAKGATAVIFGITTFLFFSLSIITGRLSDRFGPRLVLVIGAAASKRMISLGLCLFCLPLSSFIKISS